MILLHWVRSCYKCHNIALNLRELWSLRILNLNVGLIINNNLQIIL